MLAKKQAPSGAPEWVLTYGDMMSLLLCFFILLAAFADYSSGGGEESVREAIQSIQQALGMKTPVSSSSSKIDFRALLSKLQSLARPDSKNDYGDAHEKGMYGKEFRLRKIRDGMEITLGGPVVFQPFSAEISPEGEEAIEQIAGAIRGHRNKMEVRGHAAEEPRPPGWSEDDAIELSYRRARAVADQLILKGVDRRAIICSAVGANEPLARGVADPTRRAQGRRVEIIVRESTIDDYMKPNGTGESPAGLPATAPAATSGPGR